MRFITHQIARRNASDCASALAALLQPDGRFIYRYLLGQPKVNQGYYDTIRHAGSVWYLIDADLTIGPLDGVREAAIASAEHMVDQFLVPYAGEDMLGMLSEGFVKLGGSGLAIVTLCRLWEATNDQRYLDLAGRVGRFVLAQEQDTGDFVQVRNYPLGVVHPARDPFSAGQAVMGLMYLFERTGEQALLKAAERYTRFLNKASYGVKTHSHWMLYALDKVYEAAPSPDILAYADRIAGGMLNDTAYRKQGLSTPIACFTEGLLAYDRLLAKSGMEPTDPKRTVTMRAVRQNLSLILKYRREGGVYVAGDKDPEVRIDYIVHPGCCFLGYAVQMGNDTRH